MSRRSPVALALVVLALLALAPAAAAAPAVRLFAFAWGAERAADGSWGDIPSGGKRIIVQASSTEECRSLELEVLESPRPLAAGEIFRNATNAEWEFRVSAPVVGPDVYRFKVRCIYALIATAESSESRVEVQRYAPPPAPTPANTRTGAKKGGKGTRNGAAGASSRGGLRALATGIDLVDAFAARDLIAARLHLLLGSLRHRPARSAPPSRSGRRPRSGLPAGLAAAQATAVRAALANLDAQVALGRAAVGSLARFAAADEAGDAATARRQALATADLLERWSGAIGDDGSLRGDAQAAIASLGLPTVTLAPEDATALRALAARGALPAGLGAALDAAGATAEERAVAANALGAIEASAVQAYRPTIEATPSDLIDEAAAARELRELAAFLRAGSATTVPPNGPAQATGTGSSAASAASAILRRGRAARVAAAWPAPSSST